MFWVHVLGSSPNSGQPVDLFDCTLRWIPILQIDTTKAAHHTAAAVEDQRNLIHRGLTNQLTNSDLALQYDDVAPPRLNGKDV